MIGIIGAMQEEVQGLKNIISIIEIKEKAGMRFYVGTLFDKDVVLVKCGVGKVNAGICAQILIDDFNVDTLINLGVAGSLNDSIKLCDIVISKSTVQHDFTTGIIDDYKIGEIPNMNTRFFIADSELVKKATECAFELKLNFHTGIIATGDQFISDKSKKEFLVNEFNADCCEMEGGAIAQVCYLNKIPFVIIRSISDNANSNNTFEDFLLMSAKKSTVLVKQLVAKM